MLDHGYNVALILAAVLNTIDALIHIWVIIDGPRGYWFFGAGDRFVNAAKAGKKFPAILTSGIALVLFIWALYALSGAGVIEPLPLLRPALCIITFIYLMRGVLGKFLLPDNVRGETFRNVSSLITLVYGLVHLLGLVQQWNALA